MKRTVERKVSLVYNKKRLLILFLLVLYGVSIATILGRYATNRVSNFYTRTQKFYFNSDKLKENTATYQVDNWSGVDDYLITINMNSRDNNLNVSDYNINYNISYSCSENAVCTLSKATGTIPSSTNADFFNLTITPNANLRTGDRVYVSITAIASSPYTKTLRGAFTLVVGQENLTYEIADKANQQYLEVNITNTLSYYTVDQAFDSYQIGDRITTDTYLALTAANKEKCYSAIVTLDFDPEDVVLDMTNSNYLTASNIQNTTVNTYNYINSITFKMDASSSNKVRFYKIDSSQNYTYPIINNTPIVTVTNI